VLWVDHHKQRVINNLGSIRMCFSGIYEILFLCIVVTHWLAYALLPAQLLTLALYVHLSHSPRTTA
jgi:hypothetical protein